jgi:hypothetical protein
VKLLSFLDITRVKVNAAEGACRSDIKWNVADNCCK